MMKEYDVSVATYARLDYSQQKKATSDVPPSLHRINQFINLITFFAVSCRTFLIQTLLFKNARGKFHYYDGIQY